MTDSLFGGDAGGVCRPVFGVGPGEHIGMCLLGIAAGVPRDEVLRVRVGGGVEERDGMAGGLATAAAINAIVNDSYTWRESYSYIAKWGVEDPIVACEVVGGRCSRRVSTSYARGNLEEGALCEQYTKRLYSTAAAVYSALVEVQRRNA